MDHKQAHEVLLAAAKLRVPRFRREWVNGEAPHSDQQKVSELENWAVSAARWRGHLEEARLWMSEVQHNLTTRWNGLTDWEQYLPDGKPLKKATQQDVQQAKRKKDEALFNALSDTKHLIAQLSAQIRRIEKDEERVSRVYTFITGL